MKEIRFKVYNILELKEVAPSDVFNEVLENARIEEAEFLKDFQHSDFREFLNSTEFKNILDIFNISYTTYNDLFEVEGSNYLIEDVQGARAFGKVNSFIKELEKNYYNWVGATLTKYLIDNINNSLRYGFFNTIEDALNYIVYIIEDTEVTDNMLVETLLDNDIHYTIDGRQWLE